jgi:hypothetical protein
MKRALLFGSQTGKLRGVHGDVERLGDALGRRGFHVTRRIEAGASRDGILQAYRALIDAATSDDAVCVYYSGHGNLARNPKYAPGARQPQFLQYIVPTDDTPEAFRGVMSFELSALLEQLTRKTRNVTVILDCCHSARMSRTALASELVAKGLGAVREQGVQALLQAAATAVSTHVESNPHAIRLVAAEAEKSAFEVKNPGGQAGGVLTDAFIAVLDELADEDVSWAALGLRVRERVMQRIPDQRPDVEGPRRRRVWGTELVDDARPLALFFKGDTPMLRGGRLLGSVPGAAYGVMPAGSDAYREASALARAVVEQNLGTVSRVRLEQIAAGASLVGGLPAFPLEVPFTRRAIQLAARVPSSLRARLVASPFLKLAEPGEPGARLDVNGSDWVVFDGFGKELERRPRAAADSLDELARRLENWARADDLRQLEPGGLDVELELEHGRVVGGARVRMAEGEDFHVGDALYVALRNLGTDILFAAVFNIDAACDISLLSDASPRGRRLGPGEELVIGLDSRGELRGLPGSWPRRVPSDGPRWESLVAIVADDEQDFLLLTTPPARGDGVGPAGGLEARLGRTRRGVSRSARGDAPPPADYTVRRVDYDLRPEPRPAH